MLEAQFFGAPVFAHAGSPLCALTRSHTLTSLLAFLITHRNRPHCRSVLAALFWPDHSEQRARRNLNNALWELRCILRSASCEFYLLCDSERIQFNPTVPIRLDVGEFELDTTPLYRTSPREGRLSYEDVHRLERAVELYRGHFLEGVYDDWCIWLREELRERYLLALETLAGVHQLRSQFGAALRFARQLVQADPLAEEGHYRLVQLHALLKRPGDALDDYARYEVMWREELKLAPSPRMQALACQLKAEIESPIRSSSQETLERDIRSGFTTGSG